MEILDSIFKTHVQGEGRVFSKYFLGLKRLTYTQANSECVKFS